MKYTRNLHSTWLLWVGNVLGCCLIWPCTVTMVNAHEVASTRLSLVQREAAHVSATFYVSPPDFFKPVLDGQITAQTVFVHLASLDDAAFEDLYTKAQTFYQQKISFKLNKDKQAYLSYWQFASWQSVKRQIQLDLAQQLVNPNMHAHIEPVQFSVQLTGNSELSVVQPKLPSHWGKVLVIASKPQQRWVDSTESSQWIKF
jgi:hypothetical protein